MFRLGGGERHSRNLDYLLEDDEKPRSSRGLVIGILLALALAGGFGWLRWRQGNLPGFISGRAATSASPPGSEQASPASQLGRSEENPSATAAPPSSAVPAPSQAVAAPALSSTASTSSSGAPSETAVAPNAAVNPEPVQPSVAPPEASNSQPGQGATSTAPVGAAESSQEPVASQPATTPAEVPAPVAATVKPTPAPKPAPAPKVDPIALGEKYLYGRGVPQNCEKGLRYLKPVADQSNSKAMITMGALYATGHCVARDLPTAYRYFALALRKDPDNAALKQNAEMVWGKMTPTERQQAIRLTQ